jgi:hypothetical protein
VELDIQGNRLTGLPEDIGRLLKLKLLNAANNDLADIPYTIGYVAALQRFSYHCFSLPDLICSVPYHFPVLRPFRIVLDGNPLRTIRRSLLTQATSDLKTYLRTRGPEPAYVQRMEAAYHFADINVFDERLREMR